MVYGTVWNCMVLYGAVLYNIVWYGTVWYGTASYGMECTQYCMVWSVGGGGRVIRGNHWPLATPILVTLNIAMYTITKYTVMYTIT